MANQGIIHARRSDWSSKTMCGTPRAIMAAPVAEFRTWDRQCVRCAAKVAEMDARKLNRSKEQANSPS